MEMEQQPQAVKITEDVMHNVNKKIFKHYLKRRKVERSEHG